MTWTRTARAVALAAAMTALVACGGTTDADPGASVDAAAEEPAADDDAAPEEPMADADDGFAAEDEACGLLTEQEVTDAIGAHAPGAADVMLGGCWWEGEETLSTGQPVAVHVAVLPPDHYETLADIGEPIDGVAHGATYSDLAGELWFPCRDGQFCGIRVALGDADERRAVAERLGQAVAGRV